MLIIFNRKCKEKCEFLIRKFVYYIYDFILDFVDDQVSFPIRSYFLLYMNEITTSLILINEMQRISRTLELYLTRTETSINQVKSY